MTDRRRTGGTRKPAASASGRRPQGTRSQAGRAKSTRQQPVRSQSTRSQGQGRPQQHPGRKRNKAKRRIRLAVIFFAIILAFVLAGVGMVYYRYQQDLKVDRSPIVVVDGTDISGMTEEEAFNAIMAKYPWSIKVVYDGGEHPIDDLLSPIVMDAVREAQAEEQALIAKEEAVEFWDRIHRLSEEVDKPRIDKDLKELENTDFLAAEVAGEIGDKLNEESENGVMTGYDATTGTFEYAESKSGREVDTFKLSSDIREALSSGNYTATIDVSIKTIEPTVSKDQYKKIGSYTTHTTNNADRNTNVSLAAKAINGTVLQPGERFSYNDKVGKRTPEKGYKEAGAYAEGTVVMEYGGGVCQVSSTLYNAVVAAGMDASERTAHTFEPTYVTPGQDATVSYTQPDFAFVNTSPYPIGILASYANRTVVVDIYGISLLGEGEKRYLTSEKVGDAPGGGYEYVEDPTMPFGSEEIVTPESPGSVWKTYIVTEKNGEVVDKVYLHSSRYKGHSGTMRHNTTNPAVPPVPGMPVAQPAAPAAETPAE
ncbi:MAG: VanW family protein [Lachnospiraceae bacterium]|nr:VanW family protein [Lachnospiraceae bacterium]